MKSSGAPSGRSRWFASRGIHKNCYDTAEAYGKKGYYVAGVNIAGFTKVAYVTLAYGVV
jgi:glutamate dehydrogenase (NADP+)